MLRRDKSHRIDQIWTKKESLSSFIQSTNFGEVPGTVPKAMDTPTGQDSKEFSALRTGGHWTRTGNAYGAVMCALRESKRDCCLRRGNKGALRLSGETSWKKTQQVQGFWDWTRRAEVPSCIHSVWRVGGLINGQGHPLRAVGSQGARVPPWGAGGNGRAHLSVFWGTAPGSGTEGPVWRDRQGWERTPQSQHSWTPSGCGEELERLWGADGKEACSLFEDVELIPERDEVGVGLSEKGWRGRVSCVDSSMRIRSGQTWRPDDTGGSGLAMWGWNTSGATADTARTSSVHLRPLTFCSW